MYNAELVLTSLTRIGLAFAGLFLVAPRGVFRHMPGDPPLDMLFANYIRMVLFLQVAGYALAACRLYEVLSLVAVYLALMILHVRFSMTPAERALARERMAARGLDIAERGVRAGQVVRRFVAAARARWCAIQRLARDPLNVVDCLMVLAVTAYAAYLRFLDPLRNAAPAMSDSYVTLAWMKYIERRQLFHDGVYPHGFHLFLSALRKFSAVDGLLVLKYAGPLNSTITTLSTYYFVSRITGNPLAGVASAFAYGCLPSFMPYEFPRQAATNSQEFAMAFLLPAVWYILSFLVKGGKYRLFLAFCAISVIGLTHPMVALFAVAGALAAFLGSVIAQTTGFRRVLQLAGAGTGAVALAVLPLASGVLLGIGFHGSSAEFAVAEGWAWIPQVQPLFALIVAAGAGLGVFRGVLAGSRGERAGWLTGVILGCLSVVVLLAPRYGINNMALSNRAGEFYAMGLAVMVGMIAGAVTPSGSLNRTAPLRAWGWISRLAVASLMAACLIAFPQSPAEPYKMQSNESAEQYLRILLTETPTDWLVVSDFEGYSIVLGRGWHLLTGDFVDQVDPGKQGMETVRDGVVTPLEMSKIFIFYEETPYRPPLESPGAEYERKVRDQKRLGDWLRRYEAVHGPLKVYHRGPELTVYVIERPVDRKQEFDRIWGGD